MGVASGTGFTRRDFLRLAGAGAAASVFPHVFSRSARAADLPPNFVLILADDLGYADLGSFGARAIRTPCLDRMAAEGVRLTDFYCASPVCTPTRAATMTGCYPKRVGLHRGVLFPGSKTGLAPSEITIAKLLKSAGYATACVGKWHLGSRPEFLPTRHGFDGYFGIPYSNDMKPSPLMRNEETVEEPARQETLTERYTEEAVAFIEANAARPFFLYLPHTMPHVPLHVSERFRGKSEGGLYGDVVECIDWGAGVILARLKDLSLERRTWVVFTSDNGPWLSKGAHAGRALPLRDGKGTTYEGGMRVPFIAWAPGRIPAGAVSKELACVMDFYPTFASLAGAALPKDRVIDGKDVLPVLECRRGAKSPHERFYYYSKGGELEAVRAGSMKLRLAKGAGRGKAKGSAGAAELYDLGADVGEARDLAAERPDVVRALTGEMAAFDAELVRASRPAGTVI